MSQRTMTKKIYIHKNNTRKNNWGVKLTPQMHLKVNIELFDDARQLNRYRVYDPIEKNKLNYLYCMFNRITKH